MKLGKLLLRAVIGGLFVGHGTQKLFGWFGGQGPDGTGEFFERQGLRPGGVHARAAGVAEAGGGTLLLLGLQTPLAAASITGSMLTAIKAVHFKNGPWTTNGGYEYNLVLIAAMLALTEVGPGPLSLDALRGSERSGTRWALAELAAGGAGALAVHLWTARDGTPARREEPEPAREAARSTAQSRAGASQLPLVPVAPV